MSRTLKTIIASFSLIIFVNCFLTAQLTLITGQTPTQYVQDYFVGTGVSISNVSFTGTASQLAAFNNSPGNNLGIANGLLLATGDTRVAQTTTVETSNGPTNVNDGSSLFDNNGTGPGDADLDSLISPSLTMDAAVLEFDFIPQSSNLQFFYTFASEEYNEYVCSDFNDVFAFFLTGPGFPTPTNIARVPGTTLPVSINAVNNGTIGSLATGFCNGPNESLLFSPLFVDNTGGPFIEFDGLTIRLPIFLTVVPCSTYHIKLAIADATDGQFDSGIFLEANSFSTNGISINLDIASGDSTIIEGCSQGNISFTIPDTALVPYPIPIEVIGSAVNGVDYSTLPDTVFIPAGQNSTNLNINAFVDGNTEGIETLNIITETTICGPDTLFLFIGDDDLAVSTSGNPVCTGSSPGSASSIVTGGGAPYSFLWSNGQTDSIATGLVAGSYSVVVTDIYGCTSTDNISILAFNPPILSVTNDSVCQGILGSSMVVATGANPFNYLWSNGEVTPSINNLSPGNYVVTVTDDNGCSATETATIVVNSSPILSIAAVPVCMGSLGSATVNPTGTGPFSYLWSNGETSSVINNLSPGNYTVTVTDGVGCTATGSVSLASFDPPVLTIASTPVCIGELGNATANATGTMPFTYLWSNGETTSVVNNLTPGNYTVTVTDGSGCTATESVSITSFSPPLLTMTNDSICLGEFGSLSVSASGASPYTYLWSNGETTSTINNLPFGSYLVTVTDGNGCTATANAEIFQWDSPSVVISGDTLVCENENIGSLAANAMGGTSPYTYLWNSGQTTSSITNLSSGSYSVVVQDVNGCSTTQSWNITGLSTPSIDAWVNSSGLNSVTVTTGADVEVNAGGNSPESGVAYLWTGDGAQFLTNNTTASAVANINTVSTGQPFEFIVTADNGVCSSMDTVYVVSNDVSFVFFPNSFTPDDEDNSAFGPIIEGASEIIEFKVFNRWGQMVWDSPAGEQWDGTFNGEGQPRDVYVYYAVVRLVGEIDEKVLKGDVTLLR